MDWINLSQDRDGWPALVNALGSVKFGKFLDYLRTGYLFKKDSAP